jgi:hypothetical protein
VELREKTGSSPLAQPYTWTGFSTFYLREIVTSGGSSVTSAVGEVWVEPMCGEYMC